MLSRSGEGFEDEFFSGVQVFSFLAYGVMSIIVFGWGLINSLLLFPKAICITIVVIDVYLVMTYRWSLGLMATHSILLSVAGYILIMNGSWFNSILLEGYIQLILVLLVLHLLMSDKNLIMKLGLVCSLALIYFALVVFIGEEVQVVINAFIVS
ncbi:MAG: hypothetical protein MNSN_02800 [Minisyncoccus archaeiphilus]|uniref:hypothetical protein n=1 Tax=Minisyncoccus archaeiphilus TaxID=3238481 RepID=UPI002B0B2D66|nr:MAG: hypothetical protein MNSN_02800 [Candidatus Parcubacteria bacterium]